jgi:membrane protease YdiL (CAAX protease family)
MEVIKAVADEDWGLRLTSGLEVISVLTSILLIIWGIIPLLPRQRWVMTIPLLLCLGLMIHSHRLRRETLQEIGLTGHNFWQAIRLLLLPMAAGSSILICIGLGSGMLQGPERFISDLLPLTLSGVVQQYLLQGFIHRRIGLVVGLNLLKSYDDNGKRLAVSVAFLTASCFAIVHIPNLTLTILTFVAGLVWSWVYQKAPNIYAIGISHGLMSLLVINSLPSWILHSLSVGYKHFLYQKF